MAYNEGEERDENGRWTSGGGGGDKAPERDTRSIPEKMASDLKEAAALKSGKASKDPSSMSNSQLKTAREKADAKLEQASQQIPDKYRHIDYDTLERDYSHVPEVAKWAQASANYRSINTEYEMRKERGILK